MPESYLQPSMVSFMDAKRNPPETCHRMAFPAWKSADVEKSLRQAAQHAEARAAMKVLPNSAKSIQLPTK
jgi:hypothetical protein